MKLLPLARVLFLMAVIFAATSGLWGQTTGTIRGTVKDPSGAVVPGARVTAVLAEAYASRSTATTADGEYAFPALPVGRYAVVIEAAGFQEFRQLDVEVRIGHVVIVNADLQLGTLAQVVTAQASAPLIETTSTQLGAVVTDREVTQLPLNARDTYQLLQLQPGVQSQLGSDLFYGSDRTGVVSVNGGRGRSNNYTVNGGDANDQFANLPAIQPSPDSIEEFRVMTSTFDAEFGRNSGSVVNVVTKSGTNALHGNLYGFLRNQRLNARNFFEATRPTSSRTSSEARWAARSSAIIRFSSFPTKAAASTRGFPPLRSPSPRPPSSRVTSPPERPLLARLRIRILPAC